MPGFAGSGASGDFGPAKARSRAEDRQTAKHICFNLSRFQSLTGPTREASAAHIRTVVRRCTRTLLMTTCKFSASAQPQPSDFVAS
jgi:hypothetical protein